MRHPILQFEDCQVRGVYPESSRASAQEGLPEVRLSSGWTEGGDNFVEGQVDQYILFFFHVAQAQVKGIHRYVDLP